MYFAQVGLRAMTEREEVPQAPVEAVGFRAGQPADQGLPASADPDEPCPSRPGSGSATT
jgi:hypothetical protein